MGRRLTGAQQELDILSIIGRQQKVGIWASEPGHLGSNPTPTIYQLCDLRSVNQSLCASFSVWW